MLQNQYIQIKIIIKYPRLQSKLDNTVELDSSKGRSRTEAALGLSHACFIGRASGEPGGVGTGKGAGARRRKPAHCHCPWLCQASCSPQHGTGTAMGLLALLLDSTPLDPLPLASQPSALSLPLLSPPLVPLLPLSPPQL